MIGQTLSHFKITAKLGEGGMGEVYRAEDTKLGREVAIKVLPALFTEDPDRLARFEREAKVLAALSHPNIAGIFEVGQQDQVHFLAMEMAEGQDLATRLERGAIPLEDSLAIALQIASALEAAHGRGIVHRDLKPANVMVGTKGEVKVLDFGLAKAWESESDPSANMSLSPTLTAQMTQQGVLLGTAAYMSPEQARGEPADGRADVWALGIVLMEMLTGQTVYRGKTVSDSLAGILAREPNWEALPEDTPPAIRRLLARCLEKEVTERLQAVGEARIAINTYLADPEGQVNTEATDPTPASLSGRQKIVATTAALLLGAALFGVGWSLKPAPRSSLGHVRLEALLASDSPLFSQQGSGVVFSPDGRRLAYASGVGGPGGGRALFLRSLDQFDGQMLSGTETGYNPVFSPDGNWIAFVTPDELRKVSISGGAPLTLCPVSRSRGMTWGEDSTIVFAPGPNSGLARVSAAGGQPSELTQLEEGEISHRWPQFLPGEDKVVYVALSSTNPDQGTIKILDLGTGDSHVVHRGGTYPRYTTSGHLLYWREGSVFAAPLDLETFATTALPAPVLQRVVGNGEGGAMFDLAANGTLVYIEGEFAGRNEIPRQPMWIEPDGDVVPMSATTGQFNEFYLSPDETQAVTTRVSDGNADIWIMHLERDTLTRLTFNESVDTSPQFSADGHLVYFSSERDGHFQFYRKPADGSSEAERVFEGEQPQFVSDLSPNGKHLLYWELNPDSQDDLWSLDLESGEAQPFVKTSFKENAGVFSPDGRWVSYDSDESGKWEVYVRPFPGPGGKWQISNGGGEYSRWSADGASIAYRGESGAIMEVDVEATGSSLTIGTPRELFRPGTAAMYRSAWDLASDGRLLMITNPSSLGDAEGAKENLVRLAFNWFEELERLLVGQ